MPGQKVAKISVTPFDFTMTLQAMTKEKLKFSLPAVFTIGPQENDYEAMRRYATLLTGESDGTPSGEVAKSHGGAGVISSGRNHVQDIVRGIIEGETRSIVSNMTIEEVFASRAEYKKQVIDKVHGELGQFGLMVYNANVKELEDTAGSEYFKFMRLKAHESAHNKAIVDVAQAQAEGNIGQQREQARAAKEVALINAETSVTQTDLKKRRADADARVKSNEIRIEQELALSKIAATRAAEVRDAELQQDVERRRGDVELQRLRAKNVVQAKIERESRVEKAEADRFAEQTRADANRYTQEANAQAQLVAARTNAEASLVKARQSAEGEAYGRSKQAEALASATRQAAEADAYARLQQAEAAAAAAKLEAEASLVKRRAEAAGISELAKAYGDLGAVLGGPPGLMQYLMLQDNTFEKLANANARAIQGLQPKISVWNTGDSAGSQDPGAAVRNIFQQLPPLFGTIQDQTGMTPPSWMVNMPQDATATSSKQVDGQALAKREAKVNGGKH